MTAIVLAAGYATRLYPLTLDTPKALLKIGGVTMLDHLVNKIGVIGAVTRVAIVSNDKFYGQFLEWKDRRAKESEYGGRDRFELAILNDGTASEQTRLGAIGDIRYALDALAVDDELLVAASDNFFTYKLGDFYDFYLRMDADCVSAMHMDDREALRGMGVAVLSPDFTVLDFEEKPQNPKSNIAVFATYFYKRETLPLFTSYLEAGNPKDAPGNFPAWLCRRKRVAAYLFDGVCYDVGTPEAYRDLCAQYESGA